MALNQKYLDYTSSAKPGYWYRNHFMDKWNGSWNDENKVIKTHSDGSFSTEFNREDRFVEYMCQSRQVLVKRREVIHSVIEKMEKQKYKYDYKGFMDKIYLYHSWLKNISSALARIEKCKIDERTGRFSSYTDNYSHKTEVSDEELKARNPERYKAGLTTMAERFPQNEFCITKIEKRFYVSENDIYREFGLYPDGCKTKRGFNKFGGTK